MPRHGLCRPKWACALKAEATVEPDKEGSPSPAFIPAGRSPEPASTRSSPPRDKYFDGKFDLARLEEALNHFGRQGWTVKWMSTPHVKGFTGRSRRRSWFCSSAK